MIGCIALMARSLEQVLGKTKLSCTFWGVFTNVPKAFDVTPIHGEFTDQPARYATFDGRVGCCANRT